MIRFFLVAIVIILAACAPNRALIKELQKTEDQFQNHIGFYLFDPVKKKVLADYNGSKYFTPASNTKIFTFYTSLKILGDSIPAFYYEHKNDSLILWGSADPTFLYPAVHQNENVYHFLRNASGRLFVSFPFTHTQVKPLGPGWSWSDYQYSYSAERSAFPVYGNLISASVKTDNIVHTEPAVFMEHIAYASIKKKQPDLIREIDSNMLTFFPGEEPKEEKWEIPFRTTTDVVAALLSDTLKRPVEELVVTKSENFKTLKSVSVDSVYKVMMQESDNFLAEQLLLLCAATVSDTLLTDIAIRYAIKNLLQDLPDKPRWVDGSGLSRYNLFTPRTIVALWDKIQNEVPQQRLFNLLATGGKNGTIKNWYKADSPFIFGKTGSLSNNHCLSGFLVTKSGKVLLFSFMNNNFTVSANDIRKQMEKILLNVRDRH